MMIGSVTRIVPIPLPLKRSTADIGMIFRTEMRDWAPMKTLLELCQEKFGVHKALPYELPSEVANTMESGDEVGQP